MDDVPATVLSFATDKAFTAATMRRSTRGFFERMASSPALLAGLANRPRLMIWDGGLPIRHETAVIGSIGVSGAQGHEDVECAEAAVRSQGLAWEA